MIPLVDLKRQYLDLQAEIESGIHAVLASGQYILGPNVQAFEQAVAAYLGVAHAISCASGTDALHLALRAAGIGEGDEVITSTFTFFATAEAILYIGAKPVLVDIDPVTFNLEPNRVEAAVTATTRAILPVHLFGQAADMVALNDIATRHDLKMIEDCAQAFGATLEDRKVGAWGTAGTFSFYPSKMLGGCGDGGLISTDNAELADTLRLLRNHGSEQPYRHSMIGYNSRLDEIQAVILGVKLKRIDTYIAGRRRVAEHYAALLSELPGITLPTQGNNSLHVFNYYTLLSPHRQAIMDALRAADIGCAVYYPIPLHQQTVFASHYRDSVLPVAEKMAAQCLSLPIYPEMSEAQVEAVVSALRHGLDSA